MSIKEEIKKLQQKQEKELSNIRIGMENINNSYEVLKKITSDFDILDMEKIEVHLVLMSELNKAVFEDGFIKIPLTENTKRWLEEKQKECGR